MYESLVEGDCYVYPSSRGILVRALKSMKSFLPFLFVRTAVSSIQPFLPHSLRKRQVHLRVTNFGPPGLRVKCRLRGLWVSPFTRQVLVPKVVVDSTTFRPRDLLVDLRPPEEREVFRPTIRSPTRGVSTEKVTHLQVLSGRLEGPTKMSISFILWMTLV